MQESIKLAKETNVSTVENVEKEPLNLDPNLGEVVKQEQISERQQEAPQKTNDLLK